MSKDQESWLADVKNALNTLGRPSKLSDIYDQVKKIRDVTHNEQPNAIIRRILQTYSKDTVTFEKSESKYNLFGNNDIGEGILLSPNIDALFDRHLITFSDSGNIIISSLLDKKDYDRLGITKELKLSQVFKDMIKYLKIHREKFYEKQKKV